MGWRAHLRAPSPVLSRLELVLPGSVDSLSGVLDTESGVADRESAFVDTESGVAGSGAGASSDRESAFGGQCRV